jgi:hypothetical protein
MLLELLEHHEELFYSVIKSIIGAYCRQSMCAIAALSAANWRLRNIVIRWPWWRHCCKMRRCLSDIKGINMIYNNYYTLREFNNMLTIYAYWPSERTARSQLILLGIDRYHIYSNNKKNTTYYSIL